jgi:hypothetical protein
LDADTIFDLAFKKDAENQKYARQIRSSAGLVVRFGRTPLMPMSIRRPLDAVMIP